MSAGVQEAGHARIRADHGQVVGAVGAESPVRAQEFDVGEKREDLNGLARQSRHDIPVQGLVEAHALAAGADQHGARVRALDDRGGLETGRVRRDIGDVVGRVDLVPDDGRERFGDEDESAPGQDRQIDSRECRDLSAPGARCVDDVRRDDLAASRPHARHDSRAISRDVEHLGLGHEFDTAHGAACRNEVGRCQHGLDLHVLRVVDAAGEVGGDPRLVRRQVVGQHRLRDHAAGALAGSEGREVVQGGAAGGHDQAALGVELAGTAHLVAEGCPQFAAEQRQGELGAGLLVGDQDVALARASGAARHGASVDDDDGEPGACAVVGAGCTDDASTDDDDISSGGHDLASRRCAQIPRT